MKEYELLEHTADAKFRAYGKTRDEVFANAVLGMTAIVVDPKRLGTDLSFRVKVTSKSLESLLFDFLDEILFLHDTEHFIAAFADHLTITAEGDKLLLRATLHGDHSRAWAGNLKAVTYSDMIVRQEQDGTWLIQVVIDI